MAVSNIEKRINEIENSLKALKEICPIAGKLAKMYVVTSENFSIGGSTSFHSARFRFAPEYGQGKNNLITLTPIVTSTYEGVSWETIPTFEVMPQDGSGAVEVIVFNLVSSDNARIIASGTSPGTFTRVS